MSEFIKKIACLIQLLNIGTVLLQIQIRIQIHLYSKLVTSVSEPDSDPVASGIIYMIRIRNSNLGSGARKDTELDFCLQTEFFT